MRDVWLLTLALCMFSMSISTDIKEGAKAITAAIKDSGCSTQELTIAKPERNIDIYKMENLGL